MDKKMARQYVKNIKKSMSDEDVLKRSESVISKIYSLTEFKENDNILTYVNYNQEVVTKDFINKCIQNNKNVYVPKVYGKEMKFHKINSLDDLKPGAYGILEPVNECSDVEDGFMVMPGVAFDKQLNRAGYGGGYYDRYLENHTNIYKAAVCFDFQIVDNIDTQDFDLKPDVLVTESEVYYGRI